MNRYKRTPALIVLLVSAILGVVYVAAWGRIEQYFNRNGGGQTIAALEKKIAAGDKTIETWNAYGDALLDAGQHSQAADAFKQVLAIAPYKRDVKFQFAVSLGSAGRSDELFNFLKDQVYSEPKLAQDLFDRPVIQKYVNEDRFANLLKEARNQAMD